MQLGKKMQRFSMQESVGLYISEPNGVINLYQCGSQDSDCSGCCISDGVLMGTTHICNCFAEREAQQHPPRDSHW